MSDPKDARIAQLEAALAQAHLDHATEKLDLQRKLTDSIKKVTVLEEDIARVLLDKSRDYRTCVNTEVEQNDTISRLTLDNNRLKADRNEMQTLLNERTRELDNTREENNDLKREAEVMKTQLTEQDSSLAQALGRLDLQESRDPPVERYPLRLSCGMDRDIAASIRQDPGLFDRPHHVDFSRRSEPQDFDVDFSRRSESSANIRSRTDSRRRM